MCHCIKPNAIPGVLGNLLEAPTLVRRQSLQPALKFNQIGMLTSVNHFQRVTIGVIRLRSFSAPHTSNATRPSDEQLKSRPATIARRFEGRLTLNGTRLPEDDFRACRLLTPCRIGVPGFHHHWRPTPARHRRATSALSDSPDQYSGDILRTNIRDIQATGFRQVRPAPTAGSAHMRESVDQHKVGVRFSDVLEEVSQITASPPHDSADVRNTSAPSIPNRLPIGHRAGPEYWQVHKSASPRHAMRHRH